MDKSIVLYACGIYNLVFAAFHVYFWKLCSWKEELPKSGQVNSAITQVLNLRLIYVFLLMTVLYFFCQEELLSTNIGLVLLVGFFLFWVGRTIEQFIFFRINAAFIQILTVTFIAGSVLHLLPLL